MQVKRSALCLLMAFLCAPLSDAWQDGPAEDSALTFLTSRALSGDRWSFAYLRERDSADAVRRIEAYIAAHHRRAPAARAANLKRLAEGSVLESSSALANLILLYCSSESAVGDSLIAPLLDSSARSQSPVADGGLQHKRSAKAHLDGARNALRSSLGELYGMHFKSSREDIHQALLVDCRDSSVLLALAYAPFEAVWQACEEWPREDRLKLLLARIYNRMDCDQTRQQLEFYSGYEILATARTTWWPVLIEEPQRDGAYLWATVAGRVVQNTAYDVLRLSIKPPDYGNVDERGEWLHLDRSDRWTYLFELEESHVGKEAIIFRESWLRSANQQSRAEHRRRDPQRAAAMWFPSPVGDEPEVRQGTIDAVRGIPESIGVPLVSLSKAECLDWCQGWASEWARELTPAALIPHIRFRPNLHPVPQVQHAAQDPDKRP